jgi:hypothetical protein
MATATVFVDDAVLGRLPAVCAKTGLDTPDHLVMTVPVGGNEGLGLAWLLVLAGPIGWLGIFVYAASRRPETLTVRVPFADVAYDDLSRARRTRRRTGWAAVGVLVAAFVALVPRAFDARTAAAALAIVSLGLLLTFFGETFTVRRALIGVALDGSRRWVTFSRVSDEFAGSVRAQHAAPSEPDVARR